MGSSFGQLTRIFKTSMAILGVLILIMQPAFAATQSDFDSIFNHTPFYDPNACGTDSTGTGVSAGTGAPDGAAFPNLDPAAMAQAIDAFVKKNNPNSPLKDLGTTIVASAKQANVNPFLVPAIALQETSLGTAGTPQVTQGNDLFNRRATPSQPNISISTGLWYKWTSVKASVDSTAPENRGAAGGGDFLSYLRAEYGSAVDSGDFVHLFSLYDPGFGGPYAATVKGWVDEMVKSAGSAPASGPAVSGSSTSSCCPSGSGDGSSATTDGTNSAGNEYSFLIGKGLTPIVAAAITGNNIWESGGSQTQLTLNPSNVNSIGATGIAQWYAGRATALHAYAQAHGKPWDDLGLQLDYLWHELQTTQNGPLKATEAQNSIKSATTTFEATFEVSGDTGSYPTRISLAKAVLHKFGGGGAGAAGGSGTNCASSSTDVGGYKNPLRDVKKLRPERIDMGVDYAGEGPVYALGSGTITNLTNSGWNYGGYDAFISEKLDSGPAANHYVFVAEACVPVHGLHIGQKVDSNTVICNMINPGSTGIETGWAQPPGLGDTIATHNGGYTEGYATAAGENYNQLLIKLGAPSGTQQPKMGSLPAGWPTW